MKDLDEFGASQSMNGRNVFLNAKSDRWDFDGIWEIPRNFRENPFEILGNFCFIVRVLLSGIWDIPCTFDYAYVTIEIEEGNYQLVIFRKIFGKPWGLVMTTSSLNFLMTFANLGLLVIPS